MVVVHVYTRNLNKDIEFYVERLALFKIKNRREDGCHLISLEDDDFRISLIYNENAKTEPLERFVAGFSAKELPKLYRRLQKTHFDEGSGLIESFFGKYLSSPGGDQFGISDTSGNRFILFEIKES